MSRVCINQLMQRRVHLTICYLQTLLRGWISKRGSI